jgi:hypothetical protein
MSTNPKNTAEQDDRKNGMLCNQPRPTRITSTALLGRWGQTRLVNVVTHLFGDGDLDAGHRMVKPPTAKEFVARKTCTIASGEVLGAVIGQATINL